MNNEKLSIIIPVFNVEKYLIKNIESLINQKYLNLELIYVDDGSTDNSGKILDEYQRKDLRIKVYHNTNHGVSYTRNFGIDKATGEYISFVDGDDYVDEDYSEYLINLIKHNRSNMAISLYHHINRDTYQDISLFEDNRSVTEIIDGIYLNKIYMAVWNKIYNRAFLDKYNIRFDDEIWYAEGMHFNIQCLAKMEYVTVGNKRVYHYISNPESAMRKGFNVKNELCAIKSLDRQREILKQNGKYRMSIEFHYMMVCFFVLCGTYKKKLEEQYTEEISICKQYISERKVIPFKVNLPMKQKIKWFLIGSAPTYMSHREVNRSVFADQKSKKNMS